MRYMLAAGQDAPIDLLYTAPSCVPATHLETSGAELGGEQVAEMLGWPGVIGLAEMMNFPGVISGDHAVLAVLQAAAGRHIDGHAPGLTGRELQAYVGAGPSTEHEATTLAEAQEKLTAGMWIMIREGSAAKNLSALVPLLSGPGAGRCLLVSDDKSPSDLLAHGHLDHVLRLAVAQGASALDAVRAVTVNPAMCFSLQDRGAITPGRLADLAVVDNLQSFSVKMTFKAGKRICANGGDHALPGTGLSAVTSTCKLPELTERSFSVAAPAGADTARVRVIGIVPGELLTETLEAQLPVYGGLVTADPAQDVLKLAVIERHGKGGLIGLGFVRGIGLKHGALASTVAHDSHNLVVVGAEDAAMLAAAREMGHMGGGQLVWGGSDDVTRLPLAVGGLMSREDAGMVAAEQGALLRAARKLGSTLQDPFMQLSFLALPVIPSLKLTDRGLVDVGAFGFVDVVVG